ncbi:MAG: phospholipid carrier-dependent glycosyltransferase [Planctomycetes bacterium]|nr:phospholipid carrier-dependent glycosyltransferase [Planctomycetota bacterium]
MNVFRPISLSAKAVSRHFSPASRSILTAAVLAFCIGRTYLYQALVDPPSIDERTWVDRSLKPLWCDEGIDCYPDQYYYARHHPAFARLAYRLVLHSMGVYELDRPMADYDHSWEWNLERGAYPPLEIEMPLRLVNVAFLAGMVLLVYLGLKRILANRFLALAGCLPIIFHPPVHTGVCPYIGADSMLLFWMAAFWYVWLLASKRGLGGVVVLGVTAGFLVSTKVNGAFAVLGACIYYAVVARGIRRLLWPMILVALAAVVFVVLNPVYRAGDFRWAFKVLSDTIALLFELKEHTADYDWGRCSRAETLLAAFPYWFFYLPTLALAVRYRHERWMSVTVSWALPTVLLNWSLIYIPFAKYAAPISVPFLVLFSAGGLCLLQEAFHSTANHDIHKAGDPETSV